MNIVKEFGSCGGRTHDISFISATLYTTELNGLDNSIYFIYPVAGEFSEIFEDNPLYLWT